MTEFVCGGGHVVSDTIYPSTASGTTLSEAELEMLVRTFGSQMLRDDDRTPPSEEDIAERLSDALLATGRAYFLCPVCGRINLQSEDEPRTYRYYPHRREE